jgi:hypothetical protein
MDDLLRPSSAYYCIRIKGHLAVHWAEWFDDMMITRLDNGESLIEGSVIDQAALHGMLNRIRDLGLPLLAVNRVEQDGEAAAHTAPFDDQLQGEAGDL